MTAMRPAPRNLQALPTLTEVIDLPVPARPPVSHLAPPPVAAPPEVVPEPALAEVPADTFRVDEGQLAARVAGEVQRQAERVLERRLREAIGPALAQAAEALLRDLRTELSVALNDLVATSVRQELERQRLQPDDGDAPLNRA